MDNSLHNLCYIGLNQDPKNSRYVEFQVDEMDKAVEVAETNMARFGLSLQEVQSRRKWVSKTRQQVLASKVLDSFDGTI